MGDFLFGFRRFWMPFINLKKNAIFCRKNVSEAEPLLLSGIFRLIEKKVKNGYIFYP